MDTYMKKGSSVFMDGSGDYHIREVGKAGIIATVILPLDIGDALCGESK